MVRLAAFLVIWLGCCGYALARGGTPEKIGASIFLVAAIASALVEQPAGSRFDSLELGVFIVDLAVLAGFFGLALASDRFWPLWMSAMQMVQVLTHLAIIVSPGVIPWGYWNAQTLWAYPMLLLLAGATLAYRRRLLRQVDATSWRRSSES